MINSQITLDIDGTTQTLDVEILNENKPLNMAIVEVINSADYNGEKFTVNLASLDVSLSVNPEIEPFRQFDFDESDSLIDTIRNFEMSW